MSIKENALTTEKLPLLPLRGEVIFPNTVVTLDVSRPRSLYALKEAMDGDMRLFVTAQKDARIDHPALKDLYDVGTFATIRQVIALPDNTARVLLEGNVRGRLMDVLEGTDGQTAELARCESAKAAMTPLQIATTRVIMTLMGELSQHSDLKLSETISRLASERDPEEFCDIAASSAIRSVEKRQALLECDNADARMQMLVEELAQEVAIANLEEHIHARVQESMDRANHEYYLREQIHAIQEELGEDEDEEIVELRERLAASKMPREARERVEKELKRLARTAVQAPESSISQNYIEYMLDLPWEVRDDSAIDISKTRRIFDEDHFGMKDVKERLIEYLAVRKQTDALKSPILCLVGPPGVGKTSIAKSMARALDRKFAQMSLGGVHDEAEIRGHRRTYVGAMPGRIISSIEHCKTVNPVFLLDEIDKMARDMRGDPASAMLEVLDPEQNATFRDHYLDAPFDLSDVLFITTANTTSTIDKALLDRMEVIEVPGYTHEEKLEIARRHLVPKQLTAHGLTDAQLAISDEALLEIIESYTRESGVRTLERLIAKVCRKVTLEFVEGAQTDRKVVAAGDLKGYLGPKAYLRQNTQKAPSVGIVNGLAWTQVGGEVMPVEALTFPGKGGIELTGKLGDVMKESATLARSVVRARLERESSDAEYFSKHDVHIHVPEGAVPKDGPSAGVALTCALLSAVTGHAARSDIAMTGEITLHGNVLPIGGVREKLLAAYRMGIKTILLPRENEKDLEEIDDAIRRQFDIRLIDTVDEALDVVLASA